MFHFPGYAKVSDIDLEDAASLGLRVPLGAGQLPRLINLRIEKASQCGCQRCGDLLLNIKQRAAAFEAAHGVKPSGLPFWKKPYKLNQEGQLEAELEKRMRLSHEELNHHDEIIDALISFEMDWQKSQRSNCINNISTPDTDQFWTSHYEEMKNHIAELRRFDGEALKDLRESVLAKAESEHS